MRCWGGPGAPGERQAPKVGGGGGQGKISKVGGGWRGGRARPPPGDSREPGVEEEAQANQKQCAARSSYTRIVAPFAGVITNRYADTGALIAAGTSSSTQAIPVVRLAQTSKLRLVLPIPESVAAQIHLGDPVKVRVQALDQGIEGSGSRFADSLDRHTPTM